MKIILLLCSVLIFSITFGQAKYKFHSENYLGVLEGNEPSAFQIQSINGFRRGTWFAGIGTGIDYYFYRTVPLFLSLSKYLTRKERSFFFSVDGGTNFVWDKSTGSAYNEYRNNGAFTPSLYFGGSAGYRISLKNKRDAVLLNIGYSAKYIEESIKTFSPCLVPPCPEYNEKYKYNFSRVSLKVGWMF